MGEISTSGSWLT